jgi:hypothetical protein
MPRLTEDQAAGVALTQELLQALAPVLDGQPTEVAIDSCAAALLAILTEGCKDKKAVRLVLHRYADRILDFAEMIT